MSDNERIREKGIMTKDYALNIIKKIEMKIINKVRRELTPK